MDYENLEFNIWKMFMIHLDLTHFCLIDLRYFCGQVNNFLASFVMKSHQKTEIIQGKMQNEFNAKRHK
jgi:hypothetical protein